MLCNFSSDSVTTDFIETSDNENKYLQCFQSLRCISLYEAELAFLVCGSVPLSCRSHLHPDPLPNTQYQITPRFLPPKCHPTNSCLQIPGMEPPKSECHQQAGFGIGKIIMARHSWWVVVVAQELSGTHLPQELCHGWICSLFPGLHHFCPFSW